ncbi:MAG: hypothetical protein OEZ43_15085 [Gammaproteobacteria bacterium]|nr:hypothetical protein [Gammaproteobacteria bacterium]
MFSILLGCLLLPSLVQAGIVTAEHQVLSATDGFAGKSDLELAITLTNHGGVDLNYVHFHMKDVEELDLMSRLMPLTVEVLPGGKRVTLKWQVEGSGSARQWLNGKSFTLIGQGVGGDGFMVPLQVQSQSASLD